MEHNTEEQRINNRWMQHTANINYTHVFSSALDRELTVNIDYNRNNSLANDLFPNGATEYTPYETYPITEITSSSNIIHFNFMGGTSDIEQTPATTDSPRKIMQNGQLIIEKNGMKYNAHGAIVR